MSASAHRLQRVLYLYRWLPASVPHPASPVPKRVYKSPRWTPPDLTHCPGPGLVGGGAVQRLPRSPHDGKRAAPVAPHPWFVRPCLRIHSCVPPTPPRFTAPTHGTLRRCLGIPSPGRQGPRNESAQVKARAVSCFSGEVMLQAMDWLSSGQGGPHGTGFPSHLSLKAALEGRPGRKGGLGIQVQTNVKIFLYSQGPPCPRIRVLFQLEGPHLGTF